MIPAAHGWVTRCTRSLVIGLFCLATTQSVRATTPVYVDETGNCNGETPCFTAIQEAVRNAHDPDGPGPANPLLADVFVFPGAYAESVDLTQMGADVNAVPGDISIVTVNATGVPTPGTASVNPPAGPALFIPDPAEFLGGITLNGFNVTSPDVDGISLDEVDGPVTLINLTAFNAAGAGLSVIDVNVRTNPGDLTVTNCTAMNNGGNGFDLAWLENIVVTGCTANANPNPLGVGISARAALNVVFTGCTGHDNGFRGLEAEAGGTIELAGCSADGNGDNGINIVYFFAPANDVTLTNCSADGNGAIGIGVSHLFAGNGNVSLSGCSADGNFQGGIFVLADRNATLVDCSADGNMDDGIFITNGTRGDVDVTDCHADGNSEDGISVLNSNNTTFADSTSTSNGERGITLAFSAGNASFTDCLATDNGGSGILGNADGTMSVLRCQGHRNVLSGINVGGAQYATVHESAANQNMAMNFQQVILGGNGIDASGGAVEIADSVANDNDATGISGGSVSDDVAVARCTANGNGRQGVAGGGVGVSIYAGTDATVFRCTAVDNLLDGINIGTNIAAVRSIGPLPDINDVAIVDSVLLGNGEDGIDLLQVDTAAGFTRIIDGNIICENQRSGLRVVDNVGVTAEGNWWGSDTGPTHPANPAGLGDDILDAANGGGGSVDFVHFIDTVSTSVSLSPASVGQPTVVSFQFSGGGGTVFLGEGPGDPNGPQTFTLNTDNGVLTSSAGTGATVGEFIANATGLLTVTLVPAFAGVANVTLHDFCNLEGGVHVSVDQADVSVTKSDNEDPILSVNPLIYTLTVENAGPSDASNVTLVDSLPATVSFSSAASTQGACSHAGGVVTCNLGTVPAGGSAVVTISVFGTVFGTITNTATLSADEADADPTNNAATEDTTVVTPTGQSPATGGPSGGDSSDGGRDDCGAGMCGYGTLGMMPFTLAGVGLMKRRQTRSA